MRMVLELLTRRQPHVRQPIEQYVERDAPLVAGKRRSDAEMDAEAERQSTPGS
jgi:hypothetical protein